MEQIRIKFLIQCDGIDFAKAWCRQTIHTYLQELREYRILKKGHHPYQREIVMSLFQFRTFIHRCQ